MRVGVSIEKSTAFRGGIQPFANVYYYEGPITVESTLECEDLVDTLVALEKTFHSADISFVRGRVWRADGTKAENVMIVDKQLTGVGAVGASSHMDKERTFMVQIRAGVDSRGRPVYLRKWFHFAASLIGGTNVSNDALRQTMQLTTAQQNYIKGIADDYKEVGVGVGDAIVMDLVSKTGREITGASVGYPWLEHHQLGDEWRSA